MSKKSRLILPIDGTASNKFLYCYSHKPPPFVRMKGKWILESIFRAAIQRLV